MLSEKIHDFVVARDTSGLEDRIKEQDGYINELEKENGTQDKTISKQASDITEKEHKVSQLEKQVKELMAQVKELAKSAPSKQNNNLVIENQIFNRFPSGDENEGLYVTKQPRVVTVDGKEYLENTALSEFKNVNLGGDLTESVTLDGIQFRLISGGKYAGKLVQDLGPHSVFEHDGKFFVRWFIRTKKELSL